MELTKYSKHLVKEIGKFELIHVGSASEYDWYKVKGMDDLMLETMACRKNGYAAIYVRCLGNLKPDGKLYWKAYYKDGATNEEVVKRMCSMFYQQRTSGSRIFW